ncbi:NADP(H)-dependent aldo-keto reductase [Silvimonas sp.]|uniref:NADP(H)-dependent aldo-keto reductase n=1 Tax=Silvimonas sp. TaxID=2650811 RepID=UPI0028411790|nr:NADP(H)-dependent aldo-keto reductase [Silvimonas sp.]MDR3429472.1 NADP(H)-dependent aldo-keto reductase [Silvimonas sp.]
MEYRKLGLTDLEVSLIGLGTMTWGEQNTEAQAHEQIDYALTQGVNFLDVAEMYPVPPKPETQGRTEQYIGTWLAKTGRRSEVVIATKAAGPVRQPHQPNHIRNGQTNHNRASLFEAVDGSLKRLQTDYIDLYQLHWPDRSTNTFGRLAYPWVDGEETVAIEESVLALAELVKSGKIRHVGVSNETPWGVAQFLAAAEKHGVAKIVSIQNPYSLVNRTFEIGLSEFSHREHVGLLAYSPMAFGALSGKYLNGARPADGRITLYERFTRYTKPEVEVAINGYVQIARKHGISPAQLALAFVNSRPFVTSNLIGATTIAQLKENIESINVKLGAEILAEIEAVHVKQPNPAP